MVESGQHSPSETVERILRHRADQGKRLLMLTHHYQAPEIVRLGDLRGDSFELSRRASEAEAEIILFCGVHFMAEAAAVLCRPDQRVLIPDEMAGCPMADMAPLSKVEKAWARLNRVCHADTEVMPITYMNSSAAVKAFCGVRGGTVCTSSNAPRAMAWALTQRRRLFFFPDQHLGRNTALDMGFSPDEIVLYDPSKEDGGLGDEGILAAKIILWKGYCHVHTRFSVDHVREARKNYPEARILVHPECSRDVVEASDGNGSTSYLVSAVEKASPGSTTVIGTEVNLVLRLSQDFPDRKVVPLFPSVCHNMARIDLESVLFVLEGLESFPPVHVEADVAKGARLALTQMLQLP